jgi:hypothetical protein
MSALLKMLVLPTVPTFVMVAAKNALPAVRRIPAAKPMARYRLDAPIVTFSPRDFGM